MEQIKHEGITKLSKGVSQISMILRPESLGRLHINIVSSAAGLSAQLTVTNKQAADLLNKNISSLKESLSDKGFNVAEINVKVTETSNSELGFENRGQQTNEKMNDFLDGKSHENSNSKFVQEKLAKNMKKLDEYSEDIQEEKETKTHNLHNGLVDYKI